MSVSSTVISSSSSSRSLPQHCYHGSSSSSSVCSWSRLMFTILLSSVLTSVSTAAGDFYRTLGVSRDATTKQIKKAYRQKSLEFHPDKNKEEGAAQKFAEISRAYEVLSDDTLKEVYDTQGEEGLQRHEQHGGQGGGDAGGFEDIFSHFGFNFGGGHGGGGRGGQGEQKTDSVEMQLRVSLKDLYLGASFDVEYVRQALCLNWQECTKNTPECQGPGVRMRRQQLAPGFVQQVQQRDDSCVARGKSWRKNCRECPNGRTEPEKVDLTVDVTAGMRPGERITFEGVADERPGMTAGDLVFVITEYDDDHHGDGDFHRDGDDQLYMTIEIPLVDALAGFSREITHLDGKKFTIEVNDVTECDHVMRVPGKGMPRRSGRGFGDLYVTFQVDFPESLTEEQKIGIERILKPGGGGSDEL